MVISNQGQLLSLLSLHVEPLAASILVQTATIGLLALFVTRLISSRRPEWRLYAYKAALCMTSVCVLLTPLIAGKIERDWDLIPTHENARPSPVLAVAATMNGSSENSSVVFVPVAPRTSHPGPQPNTSQNVSPIPENRPITNAIQGPYLTNPPAPIVIGQQTFIQPAQPLIRPVDRNPKVTYIALFAFIWIAGTVLLLIELIISHWRDSILLNGSDGKAHPIIVDTLNEVCQSTGSPMPEVRTTSKTSTPFVIGLMRPILFVPQGFESEVPPESLRAILAHELAHATNFDCRWLLLSRVATAFLWINPFVWMLHSRMVQSMEEVCDLAALAQGCPAQSYAQCLLTLSEKWARISHEPQYAMGAIPIRSSVGRRIMNILNTTTGVYHSFSRKGKIVATSIAMTALAACLFALSPSKALIWKPVVAGDTELVAAVRADNINKVRSLLAHGADVNEQDPAEASLNLMSLLKDNKDYVKARQSTHNPVVINRRGGFTPLMVAAHYGFDDLVIQLTDKGANLNAYVNQQTPLSLAVQARHPNIVKILLDKGADPNLQLQYDSPTSKSHQIIHNDVIEMAIALEQTDSLKYLIAHNAKVGDSDFGSTIEAHNWEYASILSGHGCDPNKQLGTAALRCDISAVNWLLQNGASLHAYPHEEGDLMIDAAIGGWPVLEYLHSLGLPINAKDAAGTTALCASASIGADKVTQWLLLNGADAKVVPTDPRVLSGTLQIRLVNDKLVPNSNTDINSTGEAAAPSISTASEIDSAGNLSVTIKNAANTTSRTITTNTVDAPLVGAARSDNLEIVKLLLNHGAGINDHIPAGQHGYDRLTPLEAAINNDNLEVARFLLDHGADIHIYTLHDSLLEQAIKANLPKGGMITLLLEHGANINETDEFGISPIAFAVRNCGREPIDLLIKLGADVNIKTPLGVTPIMLAHSNYQRPSVAAMQRPFGDRMPEDIVNVLLAHGADPNASTKSGFTPLMAAVCDADIDKINDLLAHRADVKAKTSDGLTPLAYAQMYTSRDPGHNPNAEEQIEFVRAQNGAVIGIPMRTFNSSLSAAQMATQKWVYDRQMQQQRLED